MDAQLHQVRHPRRIVFKLGSLLLSVAVALLAGEGIVQVLGVAPPVGQIDISSPDSAYRLSENPILGYELVPNRPGINSVGQRDVEHAIAKPEGMRRVVILGDSVVEGITPKTKFENLIAWHLQKLYAKSGTEVLNFGVRGYCTLAEVELLETKALPFKPDVVVLVFTDNDYRNFNADIALAAARERPAGVNWFFRNSDLFRVLCIKTGLFRFGQDADPTRWNSGAIGPNNVQRGLARLEELATRHGFQALVAIWPTFLDDRVIDRACLPGTNIPAIEVLAAEKGLATTRLSRVFERVRKNDLSPALDHLTNPRTSFTHGDTLHPNKTGCSFAANAIRSEIDKLGSAVAQTRPTTRFNASDLAAAQAVAKAAAMAGWDHASALTLAGETLYNRGKILEAIARYEAALRLRPNDLAANLSLGRILLQTRGNLRTARKCFERALRTDPTSAEACNGLGVVLSRVGQASEALEQFQRAVRFDGKHLEARSNLGSALMTTGQAADAIEHLQIVVNASESSESLANLGMALSAAGRSHEAIPPLRRALDLRADHPQAHLALGNALAAIGSNAEAVTHLQQALKVWPKAPEIHLNLGVALVGNGHTDQAIAHYRHALKLDADLPEAHNNLGVALARIGRHGEAVEHYRRAVELRPDYVQAHYAMGLALNAASRHGEAIEPLRRACVLSDWEVADCADALAQAYAGTSQPGQAVAAAEKALALAKEGGKVDLAREIAARLEQYRAAMPPEPNIP